jgi:hypothetical protein
MANVQNQRETSQSEDIAAIEAPMAANAVRAPGATTSSH